ncbi:MAG: hypothetical protein Q4B22_00460 [Eubacteriales bacterium]|nr:hypothetical protein [Eubacteriales bacterium]
MAIKQISAFVENRQGSLSETIKMIAETGVNMRALSIADTKEFGILRLIVSDTDKAVEALKNDTIVTTTEVIAVKMDDKEGTLYTILKVLEDAKIDIDYSYAFTGFEKGAYVIVRVSDVAAAEKVLADQGIKTLNDVDIKEL